MQPRTRLVLFGLSLLTHDMAAIVLFPLLFLFTDTPRRGLVGLAAGYAVLWLAICGFDVSRLLGSQNTQAVWRLLPDWLDMYLLSMLPALGFLWIPFVMHLVRPGHAAPGQLAASATSAAPAGTAGAGQPVEPRNAWRRNVVLLLIVLALTVLGTDTGRFAALLLPGCLWMWRARGVSRFDVWMIRLSLLIPPFFSGLGQRSVYLPDLLLALQRWLDLPSFGFRFL
jgi:hypothetical protein